MLGETDFDKVFPELKDHVFDNSLGENHVFELVKKISLTYCKVRLHHLAKEESQKNIVKKVRKTMSKLIHFKNQ